MGVGRSLGIFKACGASQRYFAFHNYQRPLKPPTPLTGLQRDRVPLPAGGTFKTFSKQQKRRPVSRTPFLCLAAILKNQAL